MLKRKIEQRLLNWKNTVGHKPLILKGCRQCGKTFSVLDFAKKNYKHVVYLNFFENPDYASVFAGSLEVDNIIMMLSALLGKNAVFEAGETVLILDEIQDCPDARTALKFFRLDGRFDGIAEFPIVKDTTPDMTTPRLYTAYSKTGTHLFFKKCVPFFIICIVCRHSTVSFQLAVREETKPFLA